jgi:hypothetical protein
MMETKKLIQEKLEFHKRQSVTNEILNRSANHLFDAYREMEMAIQFCDNPEIRERIEAIKHMLGRTIDTSGSIENSEPTVISKLQELMGDYSSKS